MAVFAYTALDRAGKRQTGTVSAESRPMAMGLVERQGLMPVDLREQTKAKHAAAAVDVTKKRVPRSAVDNFTRELANLLAAGLPLARSLHLLRRESSNATAAAIWSKVHDDVVGGT